MEKSKRRNEVGNTASNVPSYVENSNVKIGKKNVVMTTNFQTPALTKPAPAKVALIVVNKGPRTQIPRSIESAMSEESSFLRPSLEKTAMPLRVINGDRKISISPFSHRKL